MQTDALQYVHRHFLMVLFTAFCLLMAVRTTHAQQLPESDVYDNDRYETVESEDEREEEKMDDPTERIAFDLMRYADPLTGVIPDGIRSRELLFSSSLPTRTSLIESRAEKGSRIQSLPVTWHDRGPNNQGGRTRALGIDRDNESNIIAGGVSGGVWRSTDTGMTWTRVNDIDKSHSITCLVQDPRPGSRNVWYYGTGEQRANSANLPGDGIYRSTDNGLSWSLLPATSRNTPQSRDQMFDYVHRIVVNPANLEQDEVYAACYGGIARSLDGGESWQEVLGSFSNRAFYAEIAVTSTGIFYATISSDGQKTEGIWRSEDGEEWVDITPQDFPSNFQRIVIGIAPSNEDIVYFFAHTPNVGVNSTSLWVYNHNGGKGGIWEDRSSSLPAKVETYDSYCMSVAVRPDNPDVVYLGNITIYRSTNGFRDGSEVSTQLSGGQHADQHELLMFPSDPDRLLSGHDGGISYADNGLENKISWSFRNRGYTTTQYYSVAVDPVTAGSTLMIGGAQDNGSWLFDGEEIGGDGRKIFGSDGGYCAITDSAKDFYTSYQKGAIYHSQYNDSGSRIGYARVDPDGGESYLFIHPFTLDPNNQNIMYLPEGRNLWRNSDLSAIPLENRGVTTDINWEKIEPANLGEQLAVISAVTATRANPPHRLYYGTNRGRAYRLDNANTGQPEPVEITSQDFPTGYINCFSVDPHDGDRALLVFTNYNAQSIFLTTDAGSTWTPVSGNLEEKEDGRGNGPLVNWVTTVPRGDQRIYLAATSTGLYSTSVLNGMKTVWIREGEESIGNVVIGMVDSREADGFVGVGTHGRGMFSGNVSGYFTDATLRIPVDTIMFQTTKPGSSTEASIDVSNLVSSTRAVWVGTDLQGDGFEDAVGGPNVMLAPGESTTLKMRFAPDSVGEFWGTLTILHDAISPTSPRKIVLRGIASDSAASVESVRTNETILPELNVTPSTISGLGTIEFRLTKRSDVLIELYDLSGALVRQITATTFEAGNHRLAFNREGLAAGRYFVRVTAGVAGTSVVPVTLQ